MPKLDGASMESSHIFNPSFPSHSALGFRHQSYYKVQMAAGAPDSKPTFEKNENKGARSLL